MPELGDTADPAALVPGDPGALSETAWSLRVYADVLGEAAAGLGRIGAPAGWGGTAAEEFRSRFAVEPTRWAEAAECHRTAADAVEAYAVALAAAQRQAAEAIRSAGTGPAGEQEAVALLADARRRVGEVGDRAAADVASVSDRAPEAPGFLADLASGAGTVAAQLGNAAASLGYAALRNPLDGAAVVGGGLLAGVSAVGVVGGVGLSATGVGAVAGVPLGTASAAGVAAGVGIAGIGAIDLALHASGPDRVQPFQVNEDVPESLPSSATGATADRVRALGEPGESSRVRQVGSDADVRQAYDELARDGEPLDRPTYPGSWVTTPDGTQIGLRDRSRSGGPTVDVVLPNGEKWKIHVKR